MSHCHGQAVGHLGDLSRPLGNQAGLFWLVIKENDH
jgi:hypothetical protein